MKNALLGTVMLVVAFGVTATGCKRRADWEKGLKVAHLPVRAKLGTLDPVRSSSTYDSEVQSQVYEQLYTYKYLVRPYELEPLLADAMPQVSDDGLTYTIPIKKGVLFHDDECFPDGKGRELIAQDFVRSFKRMADPKNQPTGWWIYKNRIVGFDEFRSRMKDRGNAPFDWDGELKGLRAIDRYTLQIKLIRPFPQLMYVLAMSYASALPFECVEHYGDEFPNYAIGTGPFRLRSWTRGSLIILDKNPTYRDAFYPSEASPEFEAMGLLEPAGRKIPFLDAIVFHVFEQDQPRWLKFRAGDLHMVQMPADYHNAVFDAELELRPNFKKDGIKNYNLPLLDLIYRGFNFEDPIVGTGKGSKYLRQAMALALDTVEVNDAFYNNTCVLYDAPVPPGLDSYVAGITSPYRGPNLEKARELLAKAGYPGGKGLPPIQIEISNGGSTPEQAEMFTSQLRKIGIRLEVKINSFAELSSKLKKKRAQMFTLAWGADYPDAENFLQLFYGPNESPGSNNFNYKNPEYDALYDQSRTLQPGPERTAIYQKMREILIEDTPSFGHMARIRFFLWHDKLKWVLPDETFDNWRKYMDLEAN